MMSVTSLMYVIFLKGSIIVNALLTYNDQRSSEIECEKYSQAIGKTALLFPMMGSDPIAIKGKCEGIINPLVVGGEVAQPEEFPHMAALGWFLKNETFKFFCGGTLISDQWVLTAAHCTHFKSQYPIYVRLGFNRLSDEELGKIITVKDIYKHPAYKPPAMYADIALVKLSKPVTFRTNIKPACLSSQNNIASGQAWVTGWGATQYGKGPNDELLKTRVDLVDNVRCTRYYNRGISVPRGVISSMICAGDPNGGWKKDTCQGDSGGPLQVTHSNGCLYEILGITSFGKGCAFPKKPGVYTRVSHFLDWIEPIVWPAEV